jgi:hypothetical protein
MERNSSTSSAAKQVKAGKRTAPAPARYIEPAPLKDVMIEQLQYLVSHANRKCAPGCPDCIRLEQVSNCLLLPFGANTNRQISIRPAA